MKPCIIIESWYNLSERDTIERERREEVEFMRVGYGEREVHTGVSALLPRQNHLSHNERVHGRSFARAKVCVFAGKRVVGREKQRSRHVNGRKPCWENLRKWQGVIVEEYVHQCCLKCSALPAHGCLKRQPLYALFREIFLSAQPGMQPRQQTPVTPCQSCCWCLFCFGV